MIMQASPDALPDRLCQSFVGRFHAALCYDVPSQFLGEQAPPVVSSIASTSRATTPL